MLKVPDAKTKNLLDLADYIENLSPSSFDMANWDACIVGYACKRVKDMRWPSHELGQDLLGVDAEQAKELFSPQRPRLSELTPRDASRTLRHLAVTGEVVWRF